MSGDLTPKKAAHLIEALTKLERQLKEMSDEARVLTKSSEGIKDILVWSGVRPANAESYTYTATSRLRYVRELLDDVAQATADAKDTITNTGVAMHVPFGTVR